jgi:predicted amidophosphoribosyltransferase
MKPRLCLVCNRELPLDNFRFNGHGWNKSCKECQAKTKKNYFVCAEYEYQEEGFYVQQLKKAYPDTWKIIIIRIKNNDYI